MGQDRGNMNEHSAGDYLPFRGLSAWFSSSVNRAVVKKWDLYGGTFAEEGEAQFLFSDNAQAQDTVRVYGEQPGVGVFLSSWVLEVVHQRSHLQDVPLGRHILLPTHVHSVSSSTDITKWNTSRDYCDNRAQHGHHENGTRDGGRGGRSQKGVQRPVVWSSAQSDAEWQSLMGDVKTAQLDSIVHVEQVEPVDTPLFSFLPELPQFVMTRRK